MMQKPRHDPKMVLDVGEEAFDGKNDVFEHVGFS
jgi:hypothetical protein